MNNPITLTIMFTFITLLTQAQVACKCEDIYSTQKAYRYTNGAALMLCGTLEEEKDQTLFSDFKLFDCASNEVISEWPEASTCTIGLFNDTLTITELISLPSGLDFKYTLTPFYANKFTYNKSGFHKNSYFLRTQIRYSREQIKQSIDAFLAANKGNTGRNIEIADMLFCAYISGSKQAEKHFVSIPQVLGPFEGDLGEEWSRLWQLYLDYKANFS